MYKVLFWLVMMIVIIWGLEWLFWYKTEAWKWLKKTMFVAGVVGSLCWLDIIIGWIQLIIHVNSMKF